MMKKRILGFILAMVLILSCLVPAGAMAETFTGKVKMPNAGGSLHLRSWPSKTSLSAGYVQDGDAITVYADESAFDSEGEQWTKIKVSRTGKTGYIKNKYISLSGSTGSASGTTVYVSQSGGSLKVRTGPGTVFGIAGYVKHGQSISVIERGTTWSKIKVTSSGVTGYIKTQYISGFTGGSSSSGSSSAGTVSLPDSYDAASIMTRTAFGTVNLRKGAGTGYGSVAKLGRGTKLAVTGKSGDWYKVQTADGRTGYIRKDYVSFGLTCATTGNVNFRKGAGTGYGIIRELSKGTGVIVHSVSGKWAKVTAGGKDGYVHINYLKIF